MLLRRDGCRRVGRLVSRGGRIIGLEFADRRLTNIDALFVALQFGEGGGDFEGGVGRLEGGEAEPFVGHGFGSPQ